MTSKTWLVGISSLALAAGASGQTANQNNVTQTGTDNVAAVDNARSGNDNNISTIVQNGRVNRASVLQIGDLNTSEARQLGNSNTVAHTQEGNVHRAETFQTSDSNRSAIRQAGNPNSATVTQAGLRNLSQIAQGIDAGANQDFDSATFFNANGVARTGGNNRVSISQVGNDFTSTVRQRARAGGGQAADDNRVTVSQRGAGNSSSVVQESRSNFADIFQRDGGITAATRNTTSVVQGNATAGAGATISSNNRVNVAVSGQANSSTTTQDGLNNGAEVTQGLGIGGTVQVIQVGSAGLNRVAIAQYGDSNGVIVSQNTAGATATVWQQAGAPSARSRNNAVEVQQGTGTTGTAAFSAGFFGNTAATVGAATNGLSANVVQGNNPDSASWNLTQVGQDGVNLAATVQQLGSGTSSLANVVRIAQQGSANTAVAIQRAGVGSGTSSAAATGQPGDPFYFAGGPRSAEITILQSGTGNSATVEQRGQSQLARIEQGPGGGNTASILQETSAAFATAIIRQTGSNNSYAVTQDTANSYVLVSQTGSNNTVTDVVRRP
ncbi:hypothetical protein [Sphingomonas sp.]|jgi:hypothetical protein|uniref:beta strand repeat-containing protein n=1 Tax=Sphingomonas sp. TaxID=28214 RepID=UPI002D7F4517|nr:hypothetical protein [Sphingomonas sp.]HEU0044539.1 hypothetical protein [Sphingomonas sp.]